MPSLWQTVTRSGKTPWGLRWRSNTSFIVATVAIAIFSDLFLYGLVVPVLPFMLKDRINLPQDQVQTYVSGLLAVFAGASMLSSLPAGWIADKTNARQLPFLAGLVALLGATILLAVGQSAAVLFIARALQGISGAIVWTVGLALILDTVGPQHLGSIMGTVMSFASVGELAGPVLGGVLYKKAGYAGVFGLGAGLLVLDFVLRALLIEKKVAARYDESIRNEASNPRDHGSRGNDDDDDDQEANEEDALLGKKEEEYYKVPKQHNRVVKAFPLLYCMKDPRVLMGLMLGFVQATILAVFDTTIPTEAQDLFGFDSLKAGLLFIALDIPYLALGSVAGWTVDKYGTKPASVVGFGFLVPALTLLRLPSMQLVQGKNNVILYCAMLCLNGVGLAIIASPSLVEVSAVVQKYDKANPKFFGENGPYAQLYGFNSLLFCAGLTFGPLLSGALRDSIGYGNMNAVIAALSGLTAVLSYFIVGGKPKWMAKRNR